MLKTDINIIGLVFSVNIDGNDIEFNEENYGFLRNYNILLIF